MEPITYANNPRHSNDAVYLQDAMDAVKEYIESGIHGYDLEMQNRIMLSILDHYDISSLEVVDIVERNPNYVDIADDFKFADLEDMFDSFIGESVFQQMAKVPSIDQKMSILERHIKHLGYKQYNNLIKSK